MAFEVSWGCGGSWACETPLQIISAAKMPRIRGMRFVKFMLSEIGGVEGHFRSHPCRVIG